MRAPRAPRPCGCSPASCCAPCALRGPVKLSGCVCGSVGGALIYCWLPLLYLVGSRAGGARTWARRVLALKRIMWREIFPRYRQGYPPRKERGRNSGRRPRPSGAKIRATRKRAPKSRRLRAPTGVCETKYRRRSRSGIPALVERTARGAEPPLASAEAKARPDLGSGCCWQASRAIDPRSNGSGSTLGQGCCDRGNFSSAHGRPRRPQQRRDSRQNLQVCRTWEEGSHFASSANWTKRFGTLHAEVFLRLSRPLKSDSELGHTFSVDGRLLNFRDEFRTTSE